MAGSEGCALSACWHVFQTDVLAHFDDVVSDPDSSRCFESVLSHTDDPDLEEQPQPPSVYDEAPINDDPASLLNPSERSRLKANGGRPAVHFQEGADVRRRRSGEVEAQRRKLCAFLGYFWETFL